MNSQRREIFPSMLFAGQQGHIIVSVPLLLYTLSTIDGRIVFYVLLISFQLYVCSLVCLALFIQEEAASPLLIRMLRLFSVFCWGGICFMVYVLIGSLVYTRIQREPSHSPASPAITVVSCEVPEKGDPWLREQVCEATWVLVVNEDLDRQEPGRPPSPGALRPQAENRAGNEGQGWWETPIKRVNKQQGAYPGLFQARDGGMKGPRMSAALVCQ